MKVEGSPLMLDWEDWSEDAADLEQHTALKWFRGAKFGVSPPPYDVRMIITDIG